MSLARSLPTVLALLLVSPSASALVLHVLGDAGGADAGDTRETALRLAPGSYSANTTLDDADWFSFAGATAPSCLRAHVTTGHPMSVALSLASGVELLGLPSQAGVFSRTIAALPGAILLGALPDEDPWNAASIGPYTFSLVLDPPQLAGDTAAQDAGSTFATARPAPGDCFSGVFEGKQGGGIAVDLFSFDVQDGDSVTYSLATAGGGAGIGILDPAGQLLAATIQQGEAAEIAGLRAGTYHLVTSGQVTASDRAYVVGLVVGPDPGSSCRPYCALRAR